MAKVESVEETQAKVDAARKVAFDKFMSREETKLFVSMVPATQPPELLVTLLRSAFASGHEAGLDVIPRMLAERMVVDFKRGEL